MRIKEEYHFWAGCILIPQIEKPLCGAYFINLTSMGKIALIENLTPFEAINLNESYYYADIDLVGGINLKFCFELSSFKMIIFGPFLIQGDNHSKSGFLAKFVDSFEISSVDVKEASNQHYLNFDILVELGILDLFKNGDKESIIEKLQFFFTKGNYI